LSDLLAPMAQGALRGCAAHVGPLIGVNLEVGEVSLETSSEVSGGPFAVLPLAVELDSKRVGDLTLGSPLDDIAVLARRMLEDPQPDKIREISEAERDAIGEVLNLMSGAVDAAVRAHWNGAAHARPLPWWRSDQPGENRLDEGEFALARAQIEIPSAGTVALWLRIPAQFGQASPAAPVSRRLGSVLLLGLDAALQAALEEVLVRAQVKVDAKAPQDPALGEALGATEAAVLSGDRGEALQLCRALRLGNSTWELPLLLCLQNPTHSSVVEAMRCGASHVLAVPADEITILRVLQLVRAEGG
jgi:hypothetical protein